MYTKTELLLLDKETLSDIILDQQNMLSRSQKGKLKRHNLVGQAFGALRVVSGAGISKGHTLWCCRCSGDIYNPDANRCDRAAVFWGSNLKNKRQEYCGEKDCPASRQLLALRRQKGLLIDSGFSAYLQKRLRDKYALMGQRSDALREKELHKLWTIYLMYFGLNERRSAYKLEEVQKCLGEEIVSQKRELEEYLKDYSGKQL